MIKGKKTDRKRIEKYEHRKENKGGNNIKKNNEIVLEKNKIYKKKLSYKKKTLIRE